MRLLISVGLSAEMLIARRANGVGLHAEGIAIGSVITCETAMAAWLLSGVVVAVARRVAILLFSLFVCVNGRRLWIHAEDCGCFGRLAVHPAWTLALDLVMLLAVWYFGTPASRGRASDRGTPVRLAVAAASALLVPSAVLFASPFVRSFTPPRAETVALDPRSWTGEAFPLFPYIDAAAPEIQRGRCAVLLVDSGCNLCRTYLAQSPLQSPESHSSFDHVVLIDIAPGGSADPPLQGPIRMIRLRPRRAYVMNGPFEGFLADGVVLAVRQPFPP